MSTSPGRAPLVAAVTLQGGAILYWVLQALLARFELMESDPYEWLWIPQLTFAERIDDLSHGTQRGPSWGVALLLVTVGPQIGAAVGSVVLGEVAKRRGSGRVRVGGRVVSAVAVVSLVLALPALGVAVLMVMMAANPKIW